MRRRLMLARTIVIAMWLAITPACSRVETPRITPVIYTYYVAADADALPLAQSLTNAYTKLFPNVQFRLSASAPAVAAARVFAGEVELGVTSVLPAHMREGAWVGDVAYDGVAVIVNAANPARGFTAPELRDVFAGSRNLWSAFDAPAQGEIEVAVRDAGDGARVAFDRAVMEGARLTTSAVVLPTSEVTVNYVSLKPNAIGYVPLSHLRARPNTGVRVIGVDGVSPAPESIATEAYALRATVHILAATEPQGELRKFVAWALGRQSKQVIESASFIATSSRDN